MKQVEFRPKYDSKCEQFWANSRLSGQILSLPPFSHARLYWKAGWSSLLRAQDNSSEGIIKDPEMSAKANEITKWIPLLSVLDAHKMSLQSKSSTLAPLREVTLYVGRLERPYGTGNESFKRTMHEFDWFMITKALCQFIFHQAQRWSQEPRPMNPGHKTQNIHGVAC